MDNPLPGTIQIFNDVRPPVLNEGPAGLDYMYILALIRTGILYLFMLLWLVPLYLCIRGIELICGVLVIIMHLNSE